MGEGYILADCSNVLLVLAEKKGMDVVSAIEAIPYIHSGYAGVLIARGSKDNGRETT